MPAPLPRNGGTRNGSAGRGYDAASKSLLHISAQGCIERKLGRLGPASGSIRMPLGSCCPILQPAAAGGRIAPQFTGDCVEAARPRRRPISCMEWPCTLRSAISSRSINERYRPESAFAEDLNIAGGMPPAFRNNLLPTGSDNPASSAASSLLNPAAIARQNLFCSLRPATEGRPGDGNGARPDRSDLRLTTFIATSKLRVLRRPFESALAALIGVVQ
ncbi:hypothetical protein ACVW0I_001596 [Bradyrhizobium sp. LM6.11]